MSRPRLAGWLAGFLFAGVVGAGAGWNRHDVALPVTNGMTTTEDARSHAAPPPVRHVLRILSAAAAVLLALAWPVAKATPDPSTLATRTAPPHGCAAPHRTVRHGPPRARPPSPWILLIAPSRPQPRPPPLQPLLLLLLLLEHQPPSDSIPPPLYSSAHPSS